MSLIRQKKVWVKFEEQRQKTLKFREEMNKKKKAVEEFEKELQPIQTKLRSVGSIHLFGISTQRLPFQFQRPIF